jgi:hypothetical protein
MAGKSNYLEDLILNWETGTAPMPDPPDDIWVGLFVGDPLDTAAGGTEVTTTIRPAGRLAASFGSVTTNTGANTKANTSEVDFGAAASAVTGLSHFATFDSASGGNMLRANAFTGGAQDIGAGTQVKFAVGALVLSED